MQDPDDDRNNVPVNTPKQGMKITITPKGSSSFVMKVTKQSDGSITCRLCNENFKNIQEVTRHAPFCSKREDKSEQKSIVLNPNIMKHDNYKNRFGDERYGRIYGMFLV